MYFLLCMCVARLEETVLCSLCVFVCASGTLLSKPSAGVHDISESTLGESQGKGYCMMLKTLVWMIIGLPCIAVV